MYEIRILNFQRNVKDKEKIYKKNETAIDSYYNSGFRGTTSKRETIKTKNP